MEFGSNREGFCEEDNRKHHQQHNNQTGKAKLPHFSYNSSSSSSPPPTWDHHHHHQQQQQQMGCWLGSKYDPCEEDHRHHQKNEESTTSSTTRVVDAMMMEEDARTSASSSMVEKEHMFDKVVTPSDVGKLNRLVIPKQHAEKYFPLDSSANEKGLLLNFEDRNGKPWRFRYSYWNSSQSYVMTKGWSRFVKDKKLDAGDIVSFQRGLGELGKDRLYIDWRRRPDAPEPLSFPLHHHHHHQHLSFHRSIPWSPLLMRPPPPVPLQPMSSRDHLHSSQMNHFLNRNGFYGAGNGGGGGGGYGSQMGSVYYLRSQPLQQLQAAQMGMSMGEWQQHHQHHQHNHHQHQSLQQEENTMVFDSVPVVQGKAAAKRLRLFGVNMDCPISDTSSTSIDEDDNECDIVLSSTTLHHASMPTIQPPHNHYNHHHQQQQHSSSSSSQQAAAAHPHQLRLYNGTPMPPPIDFLNKGKASMSLD